MNRRRTVVARHFVTICVAVCTAFACGVAQSEPPGDPSGRIVWFSDMHYDPFAGGQLHRLANDSQTGWRDHTEWAAILRSMPGNQRCSPPGRDANEFLFQSVLRRAAARSGPQPDCIVVTGDFLSHDFNATYFNKQSLPPALTTVTQFNRFVEQTLAHLALSISSTFPGIPVIAALGNNDAFCGDYGVRGNSGFLTTTHRTFQRYFLPKLSDDFVKFGGCYAASIPGTVHKVVVVNSVPFLADYPESWSIEDIKPLNSRCRPLRSVELVDEMDWLSRTMRSSRGTQRAWLVCHIPPGVACYDGTQNWSRPVPYAGGQRPFVNTFRDFYVKHRRQFAGVLAGHSHNAEFKLIRDARGDVVSFVLQAPSIGRNHGNNASFRVLNFNRVTLQIEDYTTHWLDASQSPPAWGEPFSFRASYGQPDVSSSSLERIYNGMLSGARTPSGKTVLDQYFTDYSTRSGASTTKAREHYRQAVGNIIGP